MLIHVAELVGQHGLTSVSGVLHLGAHFGEEADAYDQHMPWTDGPRVVWVEGNPDLIGTLTSHVGHRPGHQIVSALVDDKPRDVRFHLASNEGASSSVLEFGTHADVHQNITYVAERDARTTTVDHLADGWDDLNFVCLDLQGLELRALQGAVRLMGHVDYVFTEVNREPLYVGCPLIDDIDAHLAAFRRVATAWTEFGWGDAFYVRNPQEPLMVHSPSKKWEDGVLVERAIDSPPSDPSDSDFVSGTRPHKAPVPTKSAVNRKRVATAENKAVAPEKASKKASKR